MRQARVRGTDQRAEGSVIKTSSHGCVHLPSEFARLLFGITHKGTTVVIAGESTAPRSVIHPPMLTPVGAENGSPTPDHDLGLMEDYRWAPEASPTGPITLVASGADRRVIVLRNGKEIGRAKSGIENAREPLGTHGYTVLDGSDSQHPRWSVVGLPGHAAESRKGHDEDAVERLRMPRELTDRLYPLLKPGTTLLVTDAPVLEHTTGTNLHVMRSGLPEEKPTAGDSQVDHRPGAAPVESILIN